MTGSEIIRQDNEWQWLVDGKPFRAYAGEVHNSSASSLAFMDQHVWPYVTDIGLNTIIFPVYWEKLEPVQGQYDFTLLEGTVRRCREHGMKAIVLWFGLWKNSSSTYVPGWVKKDPEKYFHARDVYGKKTPTISPLCAEAVDADKAAFSQLMKKIRLLNEEETTVIAVQVENEMGLLMSDRDYSPAALAQFAGRVPQELLDCYGIGHSGSYEELFAEEAGSVFMTYSYAAALRCITAAGKEQYDLPMFVNAWLEQYPWRPGSYPTGGPIARYMKIWKAVAPELAALAPDIYVAEFDEVAAQYSKDNNPFIIPEYRRNIYDLPNAFHAFGKYNALCFSVFGIEDLATPPELIKGMFSPLVMASLNIDMGAWGIDGSAAMLRQIFGMLRGTEAIRDKARKEGKLHSFVRNNELEKGVLIETENYTFQVIYSGGGHDQPKSAGMIIETGDDQFYIMGTNFSLRYMSKNGQNFEIGILDYESGAFENGEWCAEQTLNGDEASFIQYYSYPEIRRLELYRY